jgi:serine/threonine protein kinase
MSTADPEMTTDLAATGAFDPNTTVDHPTDTSSRAGAPLTNLGQIGPYVVRAEIRRWPGGKVYRAVHPQLHRVVELQVCDPAAGPEVHADFLAQTQRLAGLCSPFLANDLLEAGLADGVAYCARQWPTPTPITIFQPPTAATRLTFPNARLAQFVSQLAEGLAVVHAAGLSHGAITPDQFVLPADGVAQLRGFGAAPAVTDTPVAVDLAMLANAVGQLLVPETTILPARRWDAAICAAHPAVSEPLVATLNECRYHGAIATADDLVRRLRPLTTTPLRPVPPLDRAFRYAYEVLALCLVYMLVLVLFQTVGGWNRRFGGTSFEVSFWVVVCGLIAGCELRFGSSLIRSCFGDRLVSQRGDRPAPHVLGARALLFLLVSGGVYALSSQLSALAFQLLTTGDWLQDMFTVRPIMNLIFFCGVAGGVLIYGSLVYLRSDRLAPHDWLTGVLWAGPQSQDEKSRALAPSAATLAATNATAQPTTLSLVETKAGPIPPTGPQERVCIEHYELGRLLGQGGMGMVYQARDTHLERTVAFKLIRATGAGAVALARFQREAQLAAQIDHPQVARIFGAGTTATGEPYMVMEYIAGATLADTANGQPIAAAAAWRWIMDATEGLRAADRLGILHRDIKPANLMLTAEGQVKVTDFGLSKALTDLEPKVATTTDALPADTALTRTGAVLGTPMYMSPEQAAGQPLDCRSDMYSLGLTLVYLLTGQAPYPAGTLHQLLAQQASALPPALLAGLPGLDGPQQQLVRRLLAKNPAERFAHYDELLRELQRWQPRPAEPAKLIHRVSAYIVDCVWMIGLVWGWQLVRQYVAPDLYSPPQTTIDIREWKYVWLSLPAIPALLIVWYGLARYGSTPGLRWHRLRVVDAAGQPPGWARAAGRLALNRTEFWLLPVVVACLVLGLISLSEWIKSIVWLPAWLCVLASWISSCWRTDRPTIPDLLTNTQMVRIPVEHWERRTGWRWWLPW